MITPSDIEKLAELARVAVAPEEKESLAHDLGSIVDYISTIEEAGIEGTEGVVPALVDTVMRADGEPHASGMYTEKLLAEAPSREGDYVKVKKILS